MWKFKKRDSTNIIKSDDTESEEKFKIEKKESVNKRNVKHANKPRWSKIRDKPIAAFQNLPYEELVLLRRRPNNPMNIEGTERDGHFVCNKDGRPYSTRKQLERRLKDL